MTAYLWLKSCHLLFVIAWMAAVFYLPRILVNVAEANGEVGVRARLHLMGRRLYRFGHFVFGLAFLFGIALWLGWRVFPGSLPDMVGATHWLHPKLALVLLLLVYFIWSGRLLKRSQQGAPLPSARRLRVLNELPVLALFAIITLVLFKPF